MKRNISIILSIIMVFCMIPSISFASSNSLDDATVTFNKIFTYTGSQITPSKDDISVTIDNKVIDLTHCDINYDTNKLAGEGKITIIPRNGDTTYSGSIQKDFVINKANLENTTQDNIFVATGTDSINADKINLYLGNIAIDDSEFTIGSTPSHTQSGTYYITLTSINKNFIGSKTVSFVTGYDITGGEYTVSSSANTQNFEYDGTEKRLSQITVKPPANVNPYNLVLNRDYIVTYENNVNAGTNSAVAIIKGTGDYIGEKRINFSIKPKNMYGNTYMQDLGNVTSNTNPGPKPKVYYNGKELIENRDFQFTYSASLSTMTITATGKSPNFTGSITKIYKIGTSIKGAEISMFPVVFTYTGNAHRPNITVKKNNVTLVNGVDYSISYENNVNVNSLGMPKVVITGIGKYADKEEKSFTITSKELKDSFIRLSQYSYTHDGLEKKPVVTVYDGSRTLSSKDYDVLYLSNVAIGKGTVVVTGKNNYSGTVYAYFDILGKNMAYLSATLSKDKFIYDGYEKRPTVTVKDGYTTLSNTTDYNITYRNNTNAGIGYVVLTGKGKYSGRLEVPFTIEGENQELTTKYTKFTKYPKSTSLNLDAKSTGDSTGFSYKSSDESVVKVTAFGTVTIEGTGKATITISTTGSKKYNPATKLVTVTVKPYKASFTASKGNYKGQAKIRITKGEGVTKYQIRYGRMGNYKNYYYTHSNSSYSTQLKTLKGLQSGKAYYVKVRAYKKMADGTIVWGNWSTTKKVYPR